MRSSINNELMVFLFFGSKSNRVLFTHIKAKMITLWPDTPTPASLLPSSSQTFSRSVQVKVTVFQLYQDSKKCSDLYQSSVDSGNHFEVTAVSQSNVFLFLLASWSLNLKLSFCISDESKSINWVISRKHFASLRIRRDFG